MDTPRPLILITNDDSIEAKGLHCLIEAVSGLGDVMLQMTHSLGNRHRCL